MAEPLFALFRLVGGTALSLQLGHRLSVDLDLFTDAPYDSLDFQTLDRYLREQYPYVSVGQALGSDQMGNRRNLSRRLSLMPVLFEVRRHIADQLARRPGSPDVAAAVAIHERAAIIRVFGGAQKIFHMIHGDVEVKVVHAAGEDV